jgi:hypothetical protein
MKAMIPGTRDITFPDIPGVLDEFDDDGVDPEW